MTYSKENSENAPSLQVSDIIQFCCMSGLTGVIEVRGPSSSGRIYLTQGTIVDAVTQHERGEDALFKLVNSATPDLEFQETFHSIEPTINKEWEYLLLEAARIRDVKADGVPVATSPERATLPTGSRLLLVPQSSVVTVKSAPSDDQSKTMTPRDVALINTRVAGAGLQPGIELSILFGGTGNHYKCKLVGLDPGAYIIASSPLFQSTEQKIDRKETVAVRYSWNGSEWAFRALVLSITMDPAPMVFFTYPERIERYDLREQKRIDCLIPARAEINGKEIDGMVIDISTSGCKFSHQGSLGMTLRLNEEIRLNMNIPVRDAFSDVIHGNIRKVTQSEGKIHIGVKFQSLSDAMMETIEAYIRVISPDS